MGGGWRDIAGLREYRGTIGYAYIFEYVDANCGQSSCSVP